MSSTSCSMSATRRGGLIGNLEKGDFTILEDGKQQEVKYFNRETDLPLTIGLLIDISASQGNLIEIEKDAASRFFGRSLAQAGPGVPDQLRRGRGASPGLHQFSQAAARRAGGPARELGRSAAGCIRDRSRPSISRKGTILYDAVYLASSDQLKGQVGRKVLVLITDGEDQGSRYKIKEAIEAAQKADAIIYGFYYVDRAFYMGHGITFGGVSDSALRQMSEETGGHVFHIDRNHPLQDAFKDLQDDMRSQYAIGYTPTNPAKDGSFRRIDIKVTNKDWKVQARKGYYAIKPQS